MRQDQEAADYYSARIRKAYDRTPRALIWFKLRRRAVPEHVVGVLQGLMDECSIRIRLGTDLSVPIPLEVCVPQGDVLSPDLKKAGYNLISKELTRF